MLHYWLLLSWFGTASLQFIDHAESPDQPGAHVPLPYLSYLNLPLQDLNLQHDAEANTETYNQFYQPEDLSPSERKRRMTEEHRNWLPNLLDTDKTLYLKNEEKPSASPFIIETYEEENTTGSVKPMNNNNNMKKRSFSPWGGKRAQPAIGTIEHMWSWKRAAAREPSMPKRVRFSPWGGKRSGQIIYRPGSKSARVIYSSSIPDLTRIVSNYSPNGERIGIAGLRYGSIWDRRTPLRFLTLSAQPSENSRDGLPFKLFLDYLPSTFKPGQPYLDVNLKKDGKRKMKFSAWGGKRSPPIIGPIWTPGASNLKESSLDAILLIRDADNKEGTTKAQ